MKTTSATHFPGARNSFRFTARCFTPTTGSRRPSQCFLKSSWLSPEFKLYLIKEFQRLKEDENRRLSLAWNLNRTLSKLYYRIHTDAASASQLLTETGPGVWFDCQLKRSGTV